jgi:hypothetical protein
MGVENWLRRVLLVVLLALNACDKKPDPTGEAVQLRQAFPDTNQLVAAALSAIRSNDYPAAVLALENARGIPGVTADQLMALQRAKQAMTADLVNRAEQGDKKARADLAILERARSQ